MDSPVTKIKEPDDPHRCQALGSYGDQCNNLAVEGGTYCVLHNGYGQEINIKKKNVRNLYLARIQADMELKEAAPNFKSLREEIALLRILLERIVNSCKDDTDLILASGKIADLVFKIDKLVISCHKLDGSLGNLLDKQAILEFASKIVKILSTKIQDKLLLEEITGEIIGSLQEN